MTVEIPTDPKPVVPLDQSNPDPGLIWGDEAPLPVLPELEEEKVEENDTNDNGNNRKVVDKRS